MMGGATKGEHIYGKTITRLGLDKALGLGF